jgi:hypothetical protein
MNVQYTYSSYTVEYNLVLKSIQLKLYHKTSQVYSENSKCVPVPNRKAVEA